MQATWVPYTEEGVIRNRAALPDSVFAFPRQRKEPLTDSSHVRNALARFDQVEGVSDADRDLAFANIKGGGRVLWRRRARDQLARPDRLTRPMSPDRQERASVSADAFFIHSLRKCRIEGTRIADSLFGGWEA